MSKSTLERGDWVAREGHSTLKTVPLLSCFRDDSQHGLQGRVECTSFAPDVADGLIGCRKNFGLFSTSARRSRWIWRTRRSDRGDCEHNPKWLFETQSTVVDGSSGCHASWITLSVSALCEVLLMAGLSLNTIVRLSWLITLHIQSLIVCSYLVLGDHIRDKASPLESNHSYLE